MGSSACNPLASESAQDSFTRADGADDTASSYGSLMHGSKMTAVSLFERVGD